MLKNIPTNIITGFLGAGKSTAILNLLKQKPADERWAILVNEFGEVGIDGNLLASNDQAVFLREVPGGCMCCAAGLPMQIAMNMLLAKAKPHRLLIEPTGLGHPAEVMSVLAAEHYQDLLDLRATVTLVDARKIRDKRYTNHATFNQQLQIADIIVASKSDLYGPDDLHRLETYVGQSGLNKDRELLRGAPDITHLNRNAQAWQGKPATLKEPSSKVDFSVAPVIEFPPEGYIRRDNRGEGYFSYGWLLTSDFVFERQAIEALLQTLCVDRLKAALRTSAGYLGFNYAGDQLNITSLDALTESRLEIITAGSFDDHEFEQKLLSVATR